MLATPTRMHRAVCGFFLRAIVVVLLVASGVGARAASFYVNYSASPDENVLAQYELSILSPNAKVNLAELRKRGHRSFAYVSVVEVAADAHYRAEVLAAKIPLLGRNEAWRSDLADVSNPAWTDFVVDNLAARAVDRGFDGFFLDTADSVEMLAQKYPSRAKDFEQGLSRLVRALKAQHPGKQIILNRGFRIWNAVSNRVDGVLIESLFQTHDGRNYAAVEKSGTDWLLGKLAPMKAAGVPIYIVDYVDPARPALADATARRIQELGFNAFITTPALDGKVLAPKPAKEIPRRVLCVFGNESEDANELIRWPIDSSTSLTAQMPLEWLGYEVDYLHAAHDALPDALPQHTAILFDRHVRVPPTRQGEIATWLVRHVRAGKKALFLGEIPFQEDKPLQLVLSELGLGGSGRLIHGLTEVTALTSARMNYEAKVCPGTNRFHDLAAPAGAEKWLSLRGRGPDGERVFNAVFTAPWGGAALDPHIFFRRPDLDEHWLMDPFAFFTVALQTPAWPAPDTTTRDGVRLFFSYIDGDGFRHFSAVEAGRRSTEVVLERVIKRYPFPFTCSVIESEIRARIEDQKPGEEAELTRLARAVFALPKVEAASHSYSHPFYWAPGDKTAVLYERINLKLRPPFEVNVPNVEQEVRGSVKFIEEKLLPPGKRVRVFLWPGNCRPPLEALRITRELGIENMNGGDTIISRQHPSVTRVAPRGVPWGGELQIFAANENENLYQGRWQSGMDPDLPFYGGFLHAQDGFERMETPRRLKPVNIYFHWYSGDRPAAFNALTRLFDWASQRELHSLTASDFARLVRDARATRLTSDGENRWTIWNNGDLRTFRLARTNAVPDMGASRGVTGWRVANNALYVHTDGSKRVELVLGEKPPPHLFLVASSAELQFEKLAPKSANFYVHDVRPCRVVLGGMAAMAKLRVTVNNQPSAAVADAAGQLRMLLPDEARVSVEVN
ncbi:MAG: endo alpha-1,4 polygalactosaminidase [Verrucomicrobia bacterium]|nr:endo alpha-1,4 polygalactosaminidase [Verrucomicrobiota bacterium]